MKKKPANKLACRRVVLSVGKLHVSGGDLWYEDRAGNYEFAGNFPGIRRVCGPLVRGKEVRLRLVAEVIR